MLSILTGKNPDINRMVQEIAFELGYEWASGRNTVQYCDELWRIRCYDESEIVVIYGDGIGGEPEPDSITVNDNTIDLRGISYEY